MGIGWSSFYDKETVTSTLFKKPCIATDVHRTVKLLLWEEEEHAPLVRFEFTFSLTVALVTPEQL